MTMMKWAQSRRTAKQEQGQDASLENSEQKALDDPNEVELERNEVESESESSSEDSNAESALLSSLELLHLKFYPR